MPQLHQPITGPGLSFLSLLFFFSFVFETVLKRATLAGLELPEKLMMTLNF